MMSLVFGRAFFVSVAVFVSVTQHLFINADYQSDALSVFRKAITHDPNRVLSSWDPSLVSPCTWFHITCNGNSVIRVDLGNSYLSGRLVPELAKLTSLQYLNLNDNGFFGKIPAEFGNFQHLKSLKLNNNKLSGRIPVHELAKIDQRAGAEVVDISGNPNLCSPYTNPPC